MLPGRRATAEHLVCAISQPTTAIHLLVGGLTVRYLTSNGSGRLAQLQPVRHVRPMCVAPPTIGAASVNRLGHLAPIDKFRQRRSRSIAVDRPIAHSVFRENFRQAQSLKVVVWAVASERVSGPVARFTGSFPPSPLTSARDFSSKSRIFGEERLPRTQFEHDRNRAFSQDISQQRRRNSGLRSEGDRRGP